jgi:hypothetical protein
MRPFPGLTGVALQVSLYMGRALDQTCAGTQGQVITANAGNRITDARADQ